MQPENYTKEIADHYAAYRPSLHGPILQKCIDANSKYALGLDVGCGTGRSTLALNEYCDKVIGIDPNEAMINNATPSSQLEYQLFNGKKLSFENDSFDVITFAGSLFYAKSQSLLMEIERVGKTNAKVIIYDFEIFLDQILQDLGVIPPSKNELEYDHEVDFSGLETQHLQLNKKTKETLLFNISAKNLGHLLLADSDHYDLLSKGLGEKKLFATLTKRLENFSIENKIALKATIYYTTYQMQ